MNSHLQRKDLKQNLMLIHILDRINSRNFFYYNSKTHVQMSTRTLNNYYIIKEAFRSQMIPVNLKWNKIIEYKSIYIEIHLEFILHYITLTDYYIIMKHSD